MNRYLRWGIYTGIFATLFVPFIVADWFFFPFITGKGFAFRIIVEIVFALWIILALRDPAARPRPTLLLYALLAFIASLGVSTILSENVSKSLWSNFERMEGWILLAHLGAFFTVVTSVFRSEELWRKLLNVSIGVSVLLGVYGLFQLGGAFEIHQGGTRVDATFGNATYFAVYMLFHAFITTLALVKWSPGRLLQIGYVLALVLQLAMIFYAGTRGTMLGLIGGAFLAGLIFTIFGKGNALLRKTGAGLAILVLLIVGGFWLVKDSQTVQENYILGRFADISLEEASTRFTIWNMALKGGLERPVFGWGQESFNFVFNKYYDPSLYAQEPWFDRAHNVAMDWFVAGGALGLLLYLSLYVFGLWYLWRPGSVFDIRERAVFTGLLAAYGFHNLFVFDNLMSYVMFLFVLGYIAVRARASAAEAPAQGKPVSPQLASALSALVLVVSVSVFWVVNVPGMARAAGLIDAIRPYPDGLEQNFAHFQRVVQGSGLGRQEAHEQLVRFATQVRSQNLASLSTPEFRDRTAAFAREAFSKEIQRNPEDARLRIFYASFLRQIGDRAAARTHIEKAIELSPNKQSILFEMGILESDAGDLEASFEVFQKAYELAPEYQEARIFYAAQAIRTGRQELAHSLLEEAFGTRTPDNSFILQAYLDVGDIESAVAIAEGRVEKNPGDANLWTQLAGAYLEANRRAEAIAALEEAVRVNPDFAEQAQYFIDEIRAGRNP